MRKKIVAGNWKMNMNLQEGLSLAKEVNQQVEKDAGDVIVIVAPPFVHLADVARSLTSVKLSAQNCASESSGAYTGEVSAEMILSTGAEYVIIGHSERRSYYGEGDELLSKKVKIALENNLKPIFCCGEHLEERESGNHFKVVETQLSVGIFNLPEELFSELVIAYEPVWAIGTGVTASAEQAQEMHAYIRGLIKRKYGEQVADNTSILYGGSCKPSNARELFENPDVDGGLIGGAALIAEDFLSITRSF